MLKNSKGSPLSVFSALWDFFGKFFSPIFFTLHFFDVLQQWILKNAKGSPWRASSVVWVCREFDTLFVSLTKFFDTFMSFCYFWALNMGPTHAVPGLFEFQLGYRLRSFPTGGRLVAGYKIECYFQLMFSTLCTFFDSRFSVCIRNLSRWLKNFGQWLIELLSQFATRKIFDSWTTY